MVKLPTHSLPPQAHQPKPPVEKPAPKPIKHPPPEVVADDIVFIAHKGIYHAEFLAGQTPISVGNFATLADAKRALNKARSDLNM